MLDKEQRRLCYRGESVKCFSDERCRSGQKYISKVISNGVRNHFKSYKKKN